MLEMSRAAAAGQRTILMDIGAELRAAREAKGLSLGTLSQRTRVQARMLSAIEQNNLAGIPPRPFGRGFIRAYAQEVDLDPERTVREYFSQFPPTPEPSPPPVRQRLSPVLDLDRPSPWTGLGAAAAVLLLVVAAAVVPGWRSGNPAENAARTGTDSRGAIGTSGSTAPKPSLPATPPPSSAPVSPPGATAASSAPLRLAFSVSRPCWVAAAVDGKRTIYRIVQAGEKISLDAEREITARFGDAGAVAWTFNGRAGATLGATGAVKDMHCKGADDNCRF
jgi:cytoskeleton protein RodZ